MEKINFIEFARQLSKLTMLDCVAIETVIEVHPNPYGCIWKYQLIDIISFCDVHNLSYYIDFASNSLRIHAL